MRALLALIVLAALPACEAAQQAADDLARDRAKTAVNGVVAERFPGFDASPVTNCVIEAASAQEILQIAGSAAAGANGEVTEMVLQIAKRPAATQCIAQASIVLALS
ncbi:succinate dehydrogenase [Alisedimentitalea sp. MJ-SS2]|uniref:succinate dehydrogenase n=1 Tax=Aliisedimentitalea sp. MJ-SS2 TaxID=3049795 RepID=UPI00290A4863|nr:succinate dehydrogenase [Alisedimentitalea sp. MJ-SS2]MDU8926162.1 succinate dehydrogenase [Alisedimentitalea sp. MJ-SS2]